MYDFAEWLQATPVSVTIQSVTWIIPLTQSIHIITIGIVFVSILSIALRVLGWVRTDQAFGVVMHRFAPWIGRGLAVLALTGIVLVVGEPIRQIMSFSFWMKMTLLAVGVTTAVVFRRSLGPGVMDARQDPEFSPAIRSFAVATVLLWLAIIFLGRAIAYDVEVWGPLSLSPRA